MIRHKRRCGAWPPSSPGLPRPQAAPGSADLVDGRPRMSPWRRLLVDGCRAHGADRLILGAGAARAPDGANDLAVLDQWDAAARGNDIVERHDVFEVRLLDGILEGLGGPAVLGRSPGLVLGDGNRGELRPIHLHESNEVRA